MFVLMMVVDYVSSTEFRSPPPHRILVPYLALFFSAILLMGLAIFQLNRTLWLGTVGTTTLLLISMAVAMLKRGWTGSIGN